MSKKEPSTLYAIDSKFRSRKSKRMGVDIGEDITQDEEFQSSAKSFISKHIKHRVCSHYIPKPDSAVCECGRWTEAHMEIDTLVSTVTPKNKRWTVEEHTKPTEADSYGTIAFHGFGRGIAHRIPYVRVDERMRHNELEVVWDLLSDIWKIPHPKMIVSVTGGAKFFFMKNKLKDSFKRGLINVATSSGAWIITGGTGTGVMKFVGEAVKEYQLSSGGSRKVVALGIATWGIVDNKKALQGKNKEGCYPAHYTADHLSESYTTAPLDPNHTHFLLVDDGTENNFGKEIEFRAGLENHISSKKKITAVSGGKEVPVPVILLVLEGGVNTLKTTLEALKKETPVVVIQGSGRAADCIAMAYKENRNRDTNTLILDEEVQRERALGLFDASRMDEVRREVEVQNCLDYLKEILDVQYSHLVTIFHMDDVDTTKEIDEAILYALLKADRSNAQSQLDLAILWNRCDVAKLQIFEAGPRENVKLLDLENAMMNALLQDSADFVQLFLDNGVSLDSFLTKQRLRDLYDKVLLAENVSIGDSLLKRRLDHATKASDGKSCFSFSTRPWQARHSHTIGIIGTVINELLGEFGTNMYEGERYIIYQEDFATGVFSKKQMSFGQETKDFDNPERDLFLWAVLLNRQDLAKVFWRIGNDQIGGALTASTILENRGHRASTEEELDLATELYQAASMWEDIATGVLSECYNNDKELSHKLLIREVTTWGRRTLFAMADSGEKMEFMGQSCCQTKLNHIWKGKMALYTPVWKIFLCMFLPIFLPLIKFNWEEDRTSGRHKPRNKVSHTNGTDILSMETFDERVIQVYESRKLRPSHWKKMIDWIYYFHLAPSTKFYYHVVSTIIFLSIFSVFLMTELYPLDNNTISVYEYIIWGWTGTMIIEEIRQIATKDPKKISRKLASYFKSLWNIFDSVIHLGMIVSVVLRLTLTGNDFGWVRIFYAFTLILNFLRTLQLFYVIRNTGPKVIMIRRMLTDLAFFGAIMLTVITGYGVAVQALRVPNQNATVTLFTNIFYRPYLNIYGEFFIQDNQGPIESCDSEDVTQCSEETWFASILFAGYILLTNILLLNLLIAMFSFTFQTVQENSEKVWRFHRYSLIFEYYDKPTLAAPLIIFSHIWRAGRYIWKKCCGHNIFNSDFSKRLSKVENRMLTAFERVCMEKYLLKISKSSKEHIEAKVSSTSDRIDKLMEDLEDIKEQITKQTSLSERDLSLPDKTKRKVRPSPDGSFPDIGVLTNRIGNVENSLRKQASTLTQMENNLSRVISYLENMETNKKQ